MVTKIGLGEIAVDAVLKDIKNVHLSVYPPTGQGKVRISAPLRMDLDTISRVCDFEARLDQATPKEDDGAGTGTAARIRRP
jgi:hypothetical protein